GKEFAATREQMIAVIDKNTGKIIGVFDERTQKFLEVIDKQATALNQTTAEAVNTVNSTRQDVTRLVGYAMGPGIKTCCLLAIGTALAYYSARELLCLGLKKSGACETIVNRSH